MIISYLVFFIPISYFPSFCSQNISYQFLLSNRMSNLLSLITKLRWKYDLSYDHLPQKASTLSHNAFYLSSPKCTTKNCISLRPQNATSETVLYPNAKATSLFPFMVALFQLVNQIRFSRCLRHFSRPYYSFPFFALYYRPTTIV